MASGTQARGAVEFVAEISSNHNRDLKRALALIDAAVDAGCSAVKFQLFRVDELFAPEILARSEAHRGRREWELPLDFLPELARRASERGIAFHCTPFYLGAVEELLPYVHAYKIASYELLWDDLLAACARTGKPVTVSTGMAALDEVSHAVGVLRASGCDDPTLLHCVSGYPTPPEQCNLSKIELLRDALRCRVGWSDHSAEPAVVLRAVHHWGAAVVEAHLDLDESGVEYARGHCWLPQELSDVVRMASAGLLADGLANGAPSPIEASEREWRADPADGLRPLRSTRRGWSP